MLIARAGGRDGRVRDVRIERDRIAEIADRLAPRPDEDVVDARGGLLLPGLHDHHVHLRALAAASTSASSHTIIGSLPPSSRVTRLISRPATSMTCRPTSVEPVKAMRRTFG